MARSRTISLSAAEQRQFWDALQAPVKVTKRQRQLSKIMRGPRVLLDAQDEIAGYFTLATSQVDFGDLPPELAKKLPRRALPVAVLAWLGVAARLQGRGLGTTLLAQALNDCFAAGETFPFVAVLLDCLNEQGKQFYSQWDFRELPGRPMRLFLSAAELKAMVGR